MTTIEQLKSQLKICQDLDLTADAEKLQQQLAELETSNVCVEVQKGYSPDVRQPERITAAPAIQDAAAQEKELDEDIDEPSEIQPSEIQKIAVAPAIEDHQCAWTLAGCYLWLTSKNMSERKGVMFNTLRPFQELVNKNLLREVPEEAEWTTWNRIHGCALENFLTSGKGIKEYKQILKEVMCSTPPWWREKYLADSEISTMKEERNERDSTLKKSDVR